MKGAFPTGIDLGSTTVKVVVCSPTGQLLFSAYERHNADPSGTLLSILSECTQKFKNSIHNVAITGSAGMNLAARYALPFVQEVVASARYIRKRTPHVRTMIELGGEDSKIIFFDNNLNPDMNMNGACAGGTGAFIDQIASLLGVNLDVLNTLACKGKAIYTIASRCGVFAKTDIQSLLAQRAKPEDIAASVFKSIALHVLTSLSKGREVKREVLFAGGPLFFFPALRRAFIEQLNLDENKDVAFLKYPRLLPALGAALFHDKECIVSIDSLISHIQEGRSLISSNKADLPPLFSSNDEYLEWTHRHNQWALPSISIKKVEGPLFLGVDSGSTTTKLVCIDRNKKVVASYYKPNRGDALHLTLDALQHFKREFTAAKRHDLKIVEGASTGYGEDLIHKALDLGYGLVETMAHFKAARTLCPQASFILDIGGQDMKAMGIKYNRLDTIKINEACSSGCGSFIQTFAESLGLTTERFAKIACEATHPCDLGTRCTVFMNSSVKQALNEGRSVADIAAGLAYSVIRNSLHKVLKMRDYNDLGPLIVVQGGTFQNPAVLRALEKITDRQVIRPVEAGLMGAWGAAIYAMEQWQQKKNLPSERNILDILEAWEAPSSRTTHCHGCGNACAVTCLTFSTGQKFYTGNRCQRHFSNEEKKKQGGNLFELRFKTLFHRPTKPLGKRRGTVGIPRTLNTYELYPFWCTFFRECGFEVVLSPESHEKINELGASSVMSDNICFPAKLTHGHIITLAQSNVDRIFMPLIVHERKEIRTANNSYNCPIVCSYSDVIKSALDPTKRYGILFDTPVFSLRNPALFHKQLLNYGQQLGLNRSCIEKAFLNARKAQQEYERQMRENAQKTLEEARSASLPILAIACRPYHLDPLVNHGIPQLIADLGAVAIPADLLATEEDTQNLDDCQVVTQWAYTNRLYAGAKAAVRNKLDLLHLSSFGCGVDAVTSDELEHIMRTGGYNYSLIKIDEITNLGAARIRIRSILDFGKKEMTQEIHELAGESHNDTHSLQNKRILVPWFSEFYSPLLPPLFESLGLNASVLPPQDQKSTDIGLEFVHNDMCYPAIILIGDVVKAFIEKKYDPETTAILMTQTGGQCRATNYVPLAQKALSAAGFPDVNVPTFGVEDFETAGFKVNKKDAAKGLLIGLLGGDMLTSLYLTMAPREEVKGSSQALHSRFLYRLGNILREKGSFDDLITLLRDAVNHFNSLPVLTESVPTIGIVGEIFVNYNEYAQNYIVHKLIERRIEPVLPPLASFFFMKFQNNAFNRQTYLIQPGLLSTVKELFIEHLTGYYQNKVENVFKDFRFASPRQTLATLAHKVTRVTSLANQAGEGWLLPAEIIDMTEKGVNHILCLQPFGCLANHITGKGVEGVLRRLYPKLDMLCLDLDPGTSKTNNDNRLQLLIMSAQEDFEKKQHHEKQLA